MRARVDATIRRRLDATSRRDRAIAIGRRRERDDGAIADARSGVSRSDGRAGRRRPTTRGAIDGRRRRDERAGDARSAADGVRGVRVRRAMRWDGIRATRATRRDGIRARDGTDGASSRRVGAGTDSSVRTFSRAARRRCRADT